MVQGICFMGINDERYPLCRKIRQDVFVTEQKVDPDLEFDGMDDAAAHALIYDEKGEPAATGRMLGMGEGVFRIGRLAVQKSFRNMGYGQLVMLMLMDKARQCGGKKICIDAQVYARGFYEKLGFKADGDVFMEAGIEHIRMNCDLDQVRSCPCGK